MLGTTNSEPLQAGDIVLDEVMVGYHFCRDNAVVTIGAGVTVEAGNVLENAAGKYIPLATAANANGVLLERIVNDTAGALDYTRPVLARGPSIVNSENLSSADAAAIAALLALGIHTRDEATIPA